RLEQVRNRLTAGGSRIRTIGSAGGEEDFGRCLAVIKLGDKRPDSLIKIDALARRTHPRLVNEALGRHIEGTSLAASRGVNVQRGLSAGPVSRARDVVNHPP